MTTNLKKGGGNMKKAVIVIPNLVSLLFFWFPVLADEQYRNDWRYWVVGISGTIILAVIVVFALRDEQE